ncbi:MAG: nucleotidyl transferase AbiEii/AbiGii toxin family protein, partial [Aeromicrobium sp.]|nr:nucleotidyl transferase AbiEii/AbiGii toxin family protein [Burkholderiales bacterium]
EYLVVGGYALAAHGHPRYTGDIDIWLNPTTVNIEKLMKALAAFGFGGLGIVPDDLMKPESVIQLGYPPTRIDLLSSIGGVEFTDCFQRRLVFALDGISMPVISVTDFRANKLATGRPKDLADIAALDPPDAQA